VPGGLATDPARPDFHKSENEKLQQHAGLDAVRGVRPEVAHAGDVGQEGRTAAASGRGSLTIFGCARCARNPLVVRRDA